LIQRPAKPFVNLAIPSLNSDVNLHYTGQLH
jgi:hypothetical protein